MLPFSIQDRTKKFLSSYPGMGKDTKDVKPQRPPDMDPHEFALRQLYPSSYGEEWLDIYYERWKHDWD